MGMDTTWLPLGRWLGRKEQMTTSHPGERDWGGQTQWKRRRQNCEPIARRRPTYEATKPTPQTTSPSQGRPHGTETSHGLWTRWGNPSPREGGPSPPLIPTGGKIKILLATLTCPFLPLATGDWQKIYLKSTTPSFPLEDCDPTWMMTMRLFLRNS